VASTPEPRVIVYHAEGCHLCERALAQVRAFRDQLEFELEEIAIDGDEDLEARYRELIPVVEIEGEQVFTYYVHESAFRRHIQAAQTQLDEASL
jgi:glutaredoxin